MKLAGYILFGAGVFGALCIRLFLPKDEMAYAIAGLVFLGGSILLLLASAIRVMQGKVSLMPWDAMRVVTWIFFIVFGIRFGASLVIPGANKTIISDVVQSAMVAIFLSLHLTAYRRPQ